MLPYLELITRNGLAEMVEGTMIRYRVTAKEQMALRCMREQEALMGVSGEMERWRLSGVEINIIG